MLKRYIGYLVTCFLLVGMAGIQTSYAYYDKDKEGEDSYFQIEKYHVKCSVGKQVLVLYDNLGISSIRTMLKPIIGGPSNNFVPTEILSTNIPIHVAIRYSITPENSLSNLLYADLRLTRIYAEYASLQQRANEILAGLSVPFIERSVFFAYSQNARQSIHRRREALQGGYRLAAANFTSDNSDILSLPSADSMTPLVKPQQSGEWVALRDASGFRKLESRGEGNVSSPPSVEENTEQVRPENAQRRSESTTSGENTKIPWIVRLFIAIQNYMFSNPRDVIVIMLGIALVFSFVLSAVRRR